MTRSREARSSRANPPLHDVSPVSFDIIFRISFWGDGHLVHCLDIFILEKVCDSDFTN